MQEPQNNRTSPRRGVRWFQYRAAALVLAVMTTLGLIAVPSAAHAAVSLPHEDGRGMTVFFDRAETRQVLLGTSALDIAAKNSPRVIKWSVRTYSAPSKWYARWVYYRGGCLKLEVRVGWWTAAARPDHYYPHNYIWCR